VAEAAGQDVHRLIPSFLKLVRRMVELGFLVPAEGRTKASEPEA